MSHDQLFGKGRLFAPCIVDEGVVVNKQDIQRLLNDLGRVHYTYWYDGAIASQGEGYVIEAFADPQRSTLVANHALYLNTYSFDYLELKRSPQNRPYFNLIQETMRLQLIPLSNPLEDRTVRDLSAAALEAVVTEVLSAGWDAQLDDEDHLPPVNLD